MVGILATDRPAPCWSSGWKLTSDPKDAGRKRGRDRQLGKTCTIETPKHPHPTPGHTSSNKAMSPYLPQFSNWGSSNQTYEPMGITLIESPCDLRRRGAPCFLLPLGRVGATPVHASDSPYQFCFSREHWSNITRSWPGIFPGVSALLHWSVCLSLVPGVHGPGCWSFESVLKWKVWDLNFFFVFSYK